MYRSWITISCRDPVVYLDSYSVRGDGEIINIKFILCRSRNARLEEKDDGTVCFRPGRLANAPELSAGHYRSC